MVVNEILTLKELILEHRHLPDIDVVVTEIVQDLVLPRVENFVSQYGLEMIVIRLGLVGHLIMNKACFRYKLSYNRRWHIGHLRKVREVKSVSTEDQLSPLFRIILKFMHVLGI